jgi:UDP-2-acetamido-3-amino-2,3-dideoxy-glucuronate N-acetyltransferase
MKNSHHSKIYKHPTAEVQSEKIGDNTRIWQFVVILKEATIGQNCNINSHVFIENDVIIGNNVTIKSHISVWDGITIKDDAMLGPNVVFTNDLRPRSKQEYELKRITIETGASIGANSTILGGVNIGQFAMVGLGSVVTKDVPAYSLVYGNPARLKAWIDEKGNKMIIIDADTLQAIDGRIFKKSGNSIVLVDEKC